MILPKDELESLLGNNGLVRDSATSFDFIQLNKDIRKLHRSILKENGIAVTLRTPDRPIVLEMNKEDMWKAISMIYDNLEQYAEADSRVYAEMYTQDNKLKSASAYCESGSGRSCESGYSAGSRAYRRIKNCKSHYREEPG